MTDVFLILGEVGQDWPLQYLRVLRPSPRSFRASAQRWRPRKSARLSTTGKPSLWRHPETHRRSDGQ